MTNTDQADALLPSYYIASKTKHAAYWRANRLGGDRITATWIDEAGEGESASYTELATRCLADIQRADYLILYCEGREILKGALIEAGMALALGKRVRCVGDCDSISRVFKEHPLWSSHETIIDATSDAWAKRGEATRAPEPEGAVKALREIAKYDSGNGCCEYGCDTPTITATLTAEIAWAHDAVYAALLKAQEAKA